MAKDAGPVVKKSVKQPSPPQSDRNNIPEEVHRRASLVAQALLNTPKSATGE